MFDNYGMTIAMLFKKAENFRHVLKHPYVGTEHLLLAILEDDNEAAKKLKEYGVTFSLFKNELIRLVGTATRDADFVLYTPLLKRVIEQATNDAIDNNHGKVTEKHLLLALLEEGEGIAIRILLGLNIDLEHLYDEMKINLVTSQNGHLEIMEIGNLLNESVSSKEHVIGRDKEIEMVIEALLRKKKSNPLLVGKAGVGKTAIIEELARRINKGIVPSELLNKKIVMLEMGALVSGTKYRGEFEERLTKIIREVMEDKNIILFIDEIHTMINAGGAEGAINASDILKPYLARGEIKCIGATTLDEYYKTIYKDKALERRFFSIQIEEPDLEKTKMILMGIKKEYEEHHHIEISEQNVDDIVRLADTYIKNRCNPDKSIDLLDMICASKKMKTIRFDEMELLTEELEAIKQQKEKFVLSDDYEGAFHCKEKEKKLENCLDLLKEDFGREITYQDILEMVAKKANIPLLEDKEEILKTIQMALSKKILGQEEAIQKVVRNMSLKLNGMKKPLSLLLVGPSGVGKTATVKQIASSAFKNKLIRLDMSEYNLDTSVNKLIGVSAGYVGYDEHYIFREVIDNPYSILLVDEIEKAHPRVLNLFLQILDEGFVTDSRGEKIDFAHTFIFMTSNVLPTKGVGFVETSTNGLHEVFSKEFLGRFTDVVCFKTIKKEILKSYVEEHLKNNRINSNDLIREAETDKYGFRNLQHLIEQYNNELDIEITI